MLLVSTSEARRKRIAGLCLVKGCKQKAGCKKKLCPKHHSQQIKEKQPEAYTFNLLRCAANRRKVPFALTLEEFKEFCKRTNYIKIKGRGAGCASIDRIDPKKGYTADNIQVLEFSSNCRKQFVDYYNALPVEDESRPPQPTIDEMYGHLYAFGNPVQHHIAIDYEPPPF